MSNLAAARESMAGAQESMAGAQERSLRGCRLGRLWVDRTSAGPPEVCGCTVHQTADERTSRSALC